MRRILLLITDLEIGGTPTVVRELAGRMNALPGARVEVACLAHWGPVASQLREAGVDVTALQAHGPADLLHAVWKLVRLVRSRRIDTVFSFLIHANTVAAMASWFCREVRFIQSIQTTQPQPRWHWWLQRWVWHAAERVVVPSPSAAMAAHDWADVPREMITIIPNAIDPAQFRRPAAAPVRKTPQPPAAGADGTFDVGFIGRLDPVKRIPDLLLAIASLEKRFCLHIYGDGAQRGHIASLIDRLGITDRVKLHGTVARPQTALRRIQVLALPSQAEGFGLVLIEAMAAGVPVVATDVAGIRDVVRHDRTGLLVPVASPAALASAIRRIGGDVALRRRLIENGLDEVHHRFTWDVVLPQYVALLCPHVCPSERPSPPAPAPLESLP